MENLEVIGSEDAIEAFNVESGLYHRARDLYREIYDLANTAQHVKDWADQCSSIDLKSLIGQDIE